MYSYRKNSLIKKILTNRIVICFSIILGTIFGLVPFGFVQETFFLPIVFYISSVYMPLLLLARKFDSKFLLFILTYLTYFVGFVCFYLAFSDGFHSMGRTTFWGDAVRAFMVWIIFYFLLRFCADDDDNVMIGGGGVITRSYKLALQSTVVYPMLYFIVMVIIEY